MQKHLCAITMRSYPFGGGEDFMRDMLNWAAARAYKVSWISFAEGRTLRAATERKVQTISGNITCIIPAGGYSEPILQNELKILNPSIVTTLGMNSLDFLHVCKTLSIPTLCGWHYWTDAVCLSPKTNNVDVLSHANLHSKSPLMDEIIASSTVSYVCSQFLQDAFFAATKITVPRVLCPVPSFSKLSTVPYDPNGRTAIAAFNLHPLKSGKAFVACVRAFPNIPFIGCHTENANEEWEEILERLQIECPNVTITRWENDTTAILNQSRLVLVTSRVDETYCRVAAECMMSGVPVIATTAGNLPHLLGSSAAFVSFEEKNCVETVKTLYNDFEKLQNMSRNSLVHSKPVREQFDMTATAMLDDCSLKKPQTVMFFTIWGEQGLGYQCLSYVRALEASGITTSVFSYCSYLRENQTVRILQTDEREWIHGRVYYSLNTREKVTDEEIKSFVSAFSVRVCVIPETCWFRVFEIAALLKTLGVMVIGVPNIEIVRRDEIEKHKIFDRLWSNNMLCTKTLAEYNIASIYAGFSPLHIHELPRQQRLREKGKTTETSFLVVCGWNGKRKGISNVLDAFVDAHSKNKNLRLTITAQSQSALQPNTRHESWRTNSAISVLLGDMTHSSILSLYASHDCVIVASENEGLGLSLYEPLAFGTPIITMNCEPHNEVIKSDVNGWLVPVAYTTPILANSAAIILANVIDVDSLSMAIQNVGKMSNEEKDLFRQKVLSDYQKRFSADDFAKRMVKLVNTDEKQCDSNIYTFEKDQIVANIAKTTSTNGISSGSTSGFARQKVSKLGRTVEARKKMKQLNTK